MKKLPVLITTFCLLGIGISQLASAEVPVVDVYANGSNATTTTQNNNQHYQSSPSQTTENQSADLPQVISPDAIAQEVNQLRQKVNGLSQLDLVTQVNAMQEEIRKLRGQLEVQGHKIKQLERQKTAVPASSVQTTPEQQQADNTQKATNTADNAAPVTPQQGQLILAEQQAYQDAYQLISKREYSNAIIAMQQLLKKYPKSVYASNAHYWLGELYLIAGDVVKSRVEFMNVVEKYPDSNKYSDALLKVGYIDSDQGKWQEAKTYLNKVVKQFPNSSTARLAEARLKKLVREGH